MQAFYVQVQVGGVCRQQLRHAAGERVHLVVGGDRDQDGREAVWGEGGETTNVDPLTQAGARPVCRMTPATLSTSMSRQPMAQAAPQQLHLATLAASSSCPHATATGQRPPARQPRARSLPAAARTPRPPPAAGAPARPALQVGSSCCLPPSAAQIRPAQPAQRSPGLARSTLPAPTCSPAGVQRLPAAMSADAVVRSTFLPPDTCQAPLQPDPAPACCRACRAALAARVDEPRLGRQRGHAPQGRQAPRCRTDAHHAREAAR